MGPCIFIVILDKSLRLMVRELMMKRNWEGAENLCSQVTALKHNSSRADLCRGVVQNTNKECGRPGQEIPLDLCNSQPRLHYKVLRVTFASCPLLVSHRFSQINCQKSHNGIFWIFSYILPLNFNVYLWWKLHTCFIFLNGWTCKCLHSYFPHCNSL